MWDLFGEGECSEWFEWNRTFIILKKTQHGNLRIIINHPNDETMKPSRPSRPRGCSPVRTRGHSPSASWATAWRSGSGLGKILDPCIDQFLETEAYYEICKKHNFAPWEQPWFYHPWCSSANDGLIDGYILINGYQLSKVWYLDLYCWYSLIINKHHSWRTDTNIIVSHHHSPHQHPTMSIAIGVILIINHY